MRDNHVFGVRLYRFLNKTNRRLTGYQHRLPDLLLPHEGASAGSPCGYALRLPVEADGGGS